MLRVGSSLGGAPPKAHVVAPNGSTAIAKFPSANTDTWNVMAWEKTALDLARSAGIAVPNSTLLPVAGRQILVVERFDRAGSKDARIGYASTRTLLEARDGATASYLDIREVVEEISPAATDDLRQLWRRVAFNILISNTDDHLRNHGFLHTEGQAWTLSPAFDMNPNPDPGPKHHATAVNRPTSPSSWRSRILPAIDDAAAATLGEVVTAVAPWPRSLPATASAPRNCA